MVERHQGMVESKQHVRETSGLAVKHVPRGTLSLPYFHVEHYSPIDPTNGSNRYIDKDIGLWYDRHIEGN